MKTTTITELQKQMATVGIFAVFLLALGVWLVIVPAFQKSAQLRQEISQMGKKHELLKQIDDNTKRIHSLEKGLLQEKERHLILSHVTTLADRVKLDVESVNPDKTSLAGRGVYPPFLVRFSGSGSFGRLLAFLGGLERKNPKLSVVGLEILQSSASRRRGVLTMSTAIQTLLLTASDTETTRRGV